MMKWLANICNKHLDLLLLKKHFVRECKIVPHSLYIVLTAFTIYFQQANSCTFIEKVDCKRWNTSWSKAPMKKTKMNKVKTVVYLIHFILIDMLSRNGALHIFGDFPLIINHDDHLWVVHICAPWKAEWNMGRCICTPPGKFFSSTAASSCLKCP